MKKIIILVFCVVLIPAFVFSQQYEKPFYFDGKKTVVMDYCTDYVFISGTNEQDFNFMKINGSFQPKNSLELKIDNVSKIVTSPKNFKVKYPNRFWTKLSLKNQRLSENQYQNLLQEIRQDNPNLIVAPYLKVFEKDVVGLTNYVMVKLKKAQDFDLLMNETKNLNLDLIGYNKYMPLWFTFSVRPGGEDILKVSNLLHKTGLFEHAEPDLRFDIRPNSTSKVDKLNLVPNDPFYPDQWHLNNTGQNDGTPGIDINAVAAWDIETGDPNIVIAVLDDGFEINHPDLTGNNNNAGFDAMGNGGPSQVYSPHGTACSGIAAADGNNNEGVTGVAFNSSIMSVSFDYDGVTGLILANATNLAANNGASVLSCSWGAPATTNSPILNDAITDALQNGRNGLGCVVVFSTGNDNGVVEYPANSNPDILSVGAMSPCGERKSPTSCDGENWWGSNFGNELDIVAPGVLIPTTDRQGDVLDDPLQCGILGRAINDYNADACIPNFYTNQDYYSQFNGTSSACPMVAGVAALILSVNPSLTGQEVRDIIETTAQKTRIDLYFYTTFAGRPNGIWHEEMGYGLLDAFAAVQAANTCPVDLTLTGTETAVITHQASNSIKSTQTIESTANVDYMAGNVVEMEPGFFADKGCVFETTIGVFCKTGSKAKPNKTTSKSNALMYSMPNTRNEVNQNVVHSELELTIIPNPFQTSTTIGFQLEQEAEVNLAIFDLNGRKVKRLVEGSFGSGAHEFVWEPNELPMGIYLARLIYGDTVQTARIVVQTQ